MNVRKKRGMQYSVGQKMTYVNSYAGIKTRHASFRIKIQNDITCEFQHRCNILYIHAAMGELQVCGYIKLICIYVYFI